ncbi:hypothetical protein Tco_0903937 [Tanacetum coccineum]
MKFYHELKSKYLDLTCYANGMLFYLIMNLYVPFGIPFDPKRYYKDGDCALMLWRPRAIRHMDLPPRDQRHQYLRYEGLQYTEADIANFESRLARIYRREVHMVQVFDFGGLLDLMTKGLSARMLMEYKDAQGVSLFTNRAWRLGEAILDLNTPRALQFQLGGARRRLSWRQFILALGLHIDKEMQTVGFDAYWTETPSYTTIRDPILRLCHVLLGPPPSYTLIRDLVLRLCHRMMAHSIAVIALELPIIDMVELVRLQICEQFDDTWAWVAMEPERQPNVAAGALEVAQDAPIVDEGGQADPAPVQAPPPAAARTMP